VYDFLTFVDSLDQALEDDAQMLAEHTRMRVHDALCAVAANSRDVLQIRQALLDDLTAAPAPCRTVALAELHTIAAYLFGNNGAAREGFRETGVESDLMLDELGWLAYNPYRYAAGGLCDHVGPTIEHMSAVFGLEVVMVLSWPVTDGGCPICCYLDDHMPEEPLLCDHAAEPTESLDVLVEDEARRVLLEALTAAYQDIHAVLDRDQPTANRLSRTYRRLAIALRTMGSSGGEALAAATC
jgi:hypothetical protein